MRASGGRRRRGSRASSRTTPCRRGPPGRAWGSSPGEDVEAINDGIDPPRSNDTQNERWGTWPQEGTQWAQLDWQQPVKVDSADVYFFDDNGGVRVPASWRLQYFNGEAFVDVEGASAYETFADRY